ncbi:MAG: hypothetical protein M3O36_02225 [Myxococcota bacterium]|nr:hypothetical protein [Myxococcota bacterium]
MTAGCRTHERLDLEVWREGRESASLLASVEHLPIGGIAKAPIEREAAFLLPRRADPTRAQASLFELPAPERADVMEVAKKYSGPGFQSIIRKLAEDSVDKLGLDPASTAQFKAAHEELAASFRAGEPSATRQHGLTLFREELRHLLPADAYDEYWEALTSRVTTKLLSMR